MSNEVNNALPPAAQRALAEAEARRAEAKAKTSVGDKSNELNAPVERGGPKGVEPTRYGDWERKGRAVDF